MSAIVAVASALGAAASAARAQPPDPGDELPSTSVRDAQSSAEATRLAAAGDYLADTFRYEEAIASYRRALALYKLASDARAAAVRRRLVALARSLGVLRVDVSAVPEVAFLEVAVDGHVVSLGQLASGLMLRAGEHTVTATRPGCREWQQAFTLEPGGNAQFAVAGLTCQTEQVAMSAWRADAPRLRELEWSGSSSLAPPPWLAGVGRPDGRVGSRRSLLVWGTLFAGGGGLLLWRGTASLDDPRKSKLGARFTQMLGGVAIAGGVAALGIYTASLVSGDEGVAVAPVIDSSGGRGVAVSWGGRW